MSKPMRRTIPVFIVAAASLLAASALVIGPGAEAQRGQKRIPHSDGISNAMGELEWGMTKSELLEHFTAEVKKKYRPKLRKAPGAIEEAQLRREMQAKIQRIRDSYTEFEGHSNWDVSFLKGEYTHNNEEAMLVVQDEKAKNFYFLIDNHFWKWYRAFDQDVFAGASFEQFASVLEQRFGKAAKRTAPLREGGDPRDYLVWQDDKTRLRAIDQTQIFGFYGLVYQEMEMLSRIDELRKSKAKKKPEFDPLIEQVTGGGGDSKNSGKGGN